MENKWYLYMILCGDGTIYTGITNHVDKRFEAHEQGKGAKYTRGRGPLKLIYSMECESHSDALKKEIKVKKLTKKDKMKLSVGGLQL